MLNSQRVQLNGAGHWEPYHNGSYVVIPYEEWYIISSRSQTEREVLLNTMNTRLRLGAAIMEGALKMVDDVQCNFPEWWYEEGGDEEVKSALEWSKQNG